MDISKNPPHMFSKPSVDYFFRWHWWAAPMLFLPLALVLSNYSVKHLAHPWAMFILLFLSGFLLWTVFEYVMHRFMFHFIGKSASLKHFHYVVHGMHHVYPTDPVRVIFPPFGSALIGLVIGAIFYLILPVFVAFAVFAGFITGYVWYEFMHYAAHHIKWKLPMFRRLKRHHLLHHHSMSYSNKNFGVSTSLWDRIFNTYLG